VFIGHFGVALAAKKVAPRASLGTLILSAQWIDLIWPLLLLADVERVRIAPGHLAASPLEFVHYPWTHSLAAVTAWAALLGLVYAAIRRDGRTAIVVALLVVSHWLLDAVVHEPDLPLWPGGPVIGLGLWNSRAGSLAIESLLLAGGAIVYARATRPLDRWGSLLLWSLVAVLGLLYLGALFGPPPPSVPLLAISALAGWLFAAWGAWTDRHRGPQGRMRG
jgi:membrane-bound metal-dependent hydrolase YbcI (DUF457 family)